MKINLKINDSLPGTEVSFWKSCLFKQAVGTFASSLIALGTGITFGITSVLLPQLREDKSIQYNTSYDSWIASSAALAMVIASLGCGPILDSHGRKVAHIILGIPFTIGWIFIACANSAIYILVGRVLTGLASGSNKAISLVYIGEIADPKYRSVALFIPAVMSYIGILFSHLVGYYLSWRNSAIVCIVPSIISSIIFMFLRESPLWLIAKGRTEEGIDTFRWFRGTDEASESELKLVLERQTDKPKINIKETFKAVCSWSFFKPMLLLMVVMLNLQLTGVNVLIFYSQDIFDELLFHKVDSFLLTVVMDFIRGFAAISICLLGKLVSKNTAIHISNLGTLIFLSGLIACSVLKFEKTWLPIICIVMYIMFSSAIVTTGWTFVPELLPSTARGIGSGLNSAFSFFSLFVLVYITPIFMNAYGMTALLEFYAVSTVICGLILLLCLPKTDGKTLQSIEDTFTKTNVIRTRL